MNIQAKKLSLIEKLIGLSDTATIDKIDKILNKSERSYEVNIRPMTGEEYRARLEKSEEEFRIGKTISQDDLEKESEKW